MIVSARVADHASVDRLRAHRVQVPSDAAAVDGAAADGAPPLDRRVEKLRHAHMGPDARIAAPRAAVGELDSWLGHYHTLQRVGSAVIALWTDATQARTFRAMRLCL